MGTEVTLTICQAARLLSLSKYHVRQLCKQGLMNCTFTEKGRFARFTIEEVNRMKRLLTKYRKMNLPVPEAK